MQQGGNRHDAQDRPAWPGPEPDASTTIPPTAKKDCKGNLRFSDCKKGLQRELDATKLVGYENIVLHIMFQTGSVLHTLVHIMAHEV